MRSQMGSVSHERDDARGACHRQTFISPSMIKRPVPSFVAGSPTTAVRFLNQRTHQGERGDVVWRRPLQCG